MRGAAQVEFGLRGDRAQEGAAKKVGVWGCGVADLRVGRLWRSAASSLARRGAEPQSAHLKRGRRATPGRPPHHETPSPLCASAPLRETNADSTYQAPLEETIAANSGQWVADLRVGPRWRCAAPCLARRGAEPQSAHRKRGRRDTPGRLPHHGTPRALCASAPLRETNADSTYQAPLEETIAANSRQGGCPRDGEFWPQMRPEAPPRSPRRSPIPPGSASGRTLKISELVQNRFRARLQRSGSTSRSAAGPTWELPKLVQRRLRAEAGHRRVTQAARPDRSGA